MRKEKTLYLYQCVKCGKYFRTYDTTMFHCGSLTQWIAGIEGKGIDMNNRKVTKKDMVKIKVRGYIEMSKDNLDTILTYDDPHKGLIMSLSMTCVNTDNLEFDIIEE